MDFFFAAYIFGDEKNHLDLETVKLGSADVTSFALSETLKLFEVWKRKKMLKKKVSESFPKTWN